MNTTDAGRLGEVKVAAKLVELGYYVFIDISGKCPIDLLGWRDGKTARVQVKSTSVCSKVSWIVQLRSIRPNRTGNIIKRFDSNEFDILAIYIIPEDRVILLDPKDIKNKSSLSIPKSD